MSNRSTTDAAVDRARKLAEEAARLLIAQGPRAVSPLHPPPPARVAERYMVLAARPEHFEPVDLPLLVLYARMLAQAEAATAEIAKDMAGASPSLLQAQAAKAVHDLAMRLRCSPQARASHTNPRSQRARPALSYYDRMRLERGDAAS